MKAHEEEIALIGEIAHALSGLDWEARQRVLRWLVDWERSLPISEDAPKLDNDAD